MSDDYHFDISSGSENDSDHSSGPENDSDHSSGSESDSDHSSGSEAGADLDERELMIKYTNDENFHVDMTNFEYSTLEFGLNSISRTIVFLRNRIKEIERYIPFLEEQLEENTSEDWGEELRVILAKNRWDLTYAGTRLDCFIRKLQYVKSMIEELDTVVGESGSEGELGLTWGEQSDPEEDNDWGFEQLAIHEEERRETEDGRGLTREGRREFEAGIDDTVYSGWWQLIREHELDIGFDLVSFLGQTGLRDVDIQPFVDSAERGTAEEVQRRIDELRVISRAVTDRRTALAEDSEEDPNPFVQYEQGLRTRHFDIAETLLDDLMFDLLERQDALPG